MSQDNNLLNALDKEDPRSPIPGLHPLTGDLDTAIWAAYSAAGAMMFLKTPSLEDTWMAWQ